MRRKKDVPGIELYYKVLQDRFCMHSSVLTGVLPHFGERGRNDEEQLRQFLYRVLPRRFSIGTGFIVSSDINKNISGQIDIIVSDQFWNSPLYRELAAEVYPVETVYATIEVKGLLDKNPKGRERKTDLDRAFEHISTLRDLAKSKKYVRYEGIPSEKEPDKLVVHPKEYSMAARPRSYIFAYAQKGWKTLEDFKLHYLAEKLQKHSSAHLHGIVVLDKNWFAYKGAYTGTQVEVYVYSDNALLRFTNTLLQGIQSMPMDIASLLDYHRVRLYEGVLEGHPGESYYSGDPEPLDELCDEE